MLKLLKVSRGVNRGPRRKPATQFCTLSEKCATKGNCFK